MKLRFSNRGSALITSAVTSVATSVQLEAGGGARMPVLGVGEGFRATMIASDGTSEYVTGTAVVGDVVTVVRAQEGSAATTFASGSRFEVRMTAGVADTFLQRAGDYMDGTLDMRDHPIINVDFSAGPIRFNILHVSLMRATDVANDAPYTVGENSLIIPPNGNPTLDSRRPYYMGRHIPNMQMFDGVVMTWYGDVNNVPSWFKLCDGTNSTPDMRGKFIRGWSSTFGVSGQGGAEFVYTTLDGTHNHGGAVVGTALTINQMPPHKHEVFAGGTGLPSGSGGTLGGGSKDTTMVGGGQPHSHAVQTEPPHQHIVQTLPPFYVLAYVVFAF